MKYIQAARRLSLILAAGFLLSEKPIPARSSSSQEGISAAAIRDFEKSLIGRGSEDLWPSSAWAIQFSRDSKRLLSAGLMTSEAPPPKITKENVRAFGAYIEKLAGSKLRADKRLRVWNVATGRKIFLLPTKSTRSSTLLLPDFKTMLVAWSGYAIDSYDIHSATRQPDKRIRVPCGILGDLVLAPHGKRIALSSYCGIYVYDENGTSVNVGTYVAGRIHFGPDGKTLACFWGKSSKPQTIDIATRRQIKHPFWFYRIRDADTFCFRPDGRILAKVKGRDIEIWTTASKKGIDRRLAKMTSRLAAIRTIQFSPDGKTLAVAGLSRTKTPVEFFPLPHYAGEK